MKALTLRHPWPFAVGYLGKDIENRQWDDRTADLFGVPYLTGQLIAIHGGTPPKRGKNIGWREFCGDLAHIRDEILGQELPAEALTRLAQQAGPLTPETFFAPGIVAVAILSGRTRASRSQWAAQGYLHLMLSDVITLPEPVQCRGAQGFWTVPHVLEEEVVEQYRSVIDQRPPQHGHLTGGEWLA